MSSSLSSFSKQNRGEGLGNVIFHTSKQGRKSHILDTQRESHMEFLFFPFFFYLPTIPFQASSLVSPPHATYQETLNMTWKCRPSISPFLCFESSSLMFRQHVNHGFAVSRLCWLHRERESGEPNLLRETMRMGATVQVQTSKEWRPPLKQIYFFTASMILFSP